MKCLFFLLAFIVGCSHSQILEIPVIIRQPHKKAKFENIWLEHVSRGLILHGKIVAKNHTNLPLLKINVILQNSHEQVLTDLVYFEIPPRNITRSSTIRVHRCRKITPKYIRRQFNIVFPFYPDLQKIVLSLEPIKHYSK